MLIVPKVKNFICITAHPEGCREGVNQQIQYIKRQARTDHRQRALIVGSSTGYGLSSRICAAWSDSSPTIGVCYERPATASRTATAGWYNTAAFEEAAGRDGLYAKTINGDAYSSKVKQEAASLIRNDLGQIDLLIYSLAAPRRAMEDGTLYTSVLKTTGEPFSSKSLDLTKNVLTEKTVPPASPQEIESTIHVMGGEDWRDWIGALRDANLLSKDFRTVAYSYIGPQMTYPIYAEGSIGLAKKHLYQTAVGLGGEGIPAYVSVNKAVVTQSSSAIPIVPLYIAILYKVMKESGTHESTIEQMHRLWSRHLSGNSPMTDIPNRIRLDDLEMRTDVQEKVREYWDRIADDSLEQYADIKGYWKDFYQLFGFEHEEVDYAMDVPADWAIPSISV